MHRLGRAYAEHDPQHLGVPHPLRQRRVEARASLLDRPEVEACGVAIACMGSSGVRSASLRGIAGCSPFARPGTPGDVSEIWVLAVLRYASTRTVSDRELHEFVRRPILLARSLCCSAGWRTLF